MADDRLIVALDFHDIDDVVALVAELGDSVSFYKVGMELFYSAGAEVVPFLKNHNKKVFLDLKLHDIPNTAAAISAVIFCVLNFIVYILPSDIIGPYPEPAYILYVNFVLCSLTISSPV